MTDRLTVGQAVRLLDAKAAELEARARAEVEATGEPLRPVTALAADVALIATILAHEIRGWLTDD